MERLTRVKSCQWPRICLSCPALSFALTAVPSPSPHLSGRRELLFAERGGCVRVHSHEFELTVY